MRSKVSAESETAVNTEEDKNLEESKTTHQNYAEVCTYFNLRWDDAATWAKLEGLERRGYVKTVYVNH